MFRDRVLFSQTRVDVFAMAWQIGASRHLLTATFIALSVLVLFSSVIPQVPSEIAADPASTARWLAANTQERGMIQRILGLLGLFQIYHSVIWRSLCGLLFICLSVHLADELPIRWQLWHKGLGAIASAPYRVEIQDSLTTEAAASLQRELSAWAGAALTVEDRDNFAVTTQHGRAGIWAKPMMQIGGILFLVGLWISGQTAWYESGVSLSPEREARLVHRPDLTLQWVASQPPRIKLRSRGGESELSIGWLRPAYWEGIGFYLTDQPPAVTITGMDGKGQSLLMQPLAEGNLDTELTLTFPRAQMESEFTLPDQNMVFRLVSFEHLPGDARGEPAFLVQVFQGGQNDPILNDFITADTTIELAGVRIRLDLTRTVTLAAAYDPGFPLVLSGSVIAWLGCLMGLIMPYRGWRVTFTPGRDGVQVTGYAVDLGARPDRLRMPDALYTRRNSIDTPPRWPLAALGWIAALAPAGMMALLTASLWWGQGAFGRYWMELSGQKWLLALTLAALSWQAWRWPKVITGKRV
ncbi:MAG: hypothetical protein RML36_16005 [Anaerolineae bacterium]|nr:cytochrome c biogenesis protein ResB [Anaerolineae bacterium]MDW8100977.1 hypothetical protein [Anaerolineae bacterium]